MGLQEQVVGLADRLGVGGAETPSGDLASAEEAEVAAPRAKGGNPGTQPRLSAAAGPGVASGRAGAVTSAGPLMPAEMLRIRLREVQAQHKEEKSGRRWMCSIIGERALETTAELMAKEERQDRRRESEKEERKLREGKRRTRRLTGPRFTEGNTSGTEESSENTDGEIDMNQDTKVRQLAANRPGALLRSGLIQMVRYTGDAQGGREARVAVERRGLALGYLTRGLLATLGDRVPVRAERELRTHAEAIDGIMAGRVQAVGDLLMQRFRAVETSLIEDGGWALARHLEVIPETRVSTVPMAMRSDIVRSERKERSARSKPQWIQPGGVAHQEMRAGRDRSPPRWGEVRSALKPAEEDRRKGKGKGKAKEFGKKGW